MEPIPETPAPGQDEGFVHVELETPVLSMMQLVEQKYQTLRQTMDHEAVMREMMLSVKNTDEANIMTQFVMTHFPPATT